MIYCSEPLLIIMGCNILAFSAMERRQNLIDFRGARTRLFPIVKHLKLFISSRFAIFVKDEQYLQYIVKLNQILLQICN